MVTNRDYAKLHMGVRVANQLPRTTSQYSDSFSRLRSRKTLNIGAARFKIQVRCGKFKILKFQNFKAQKEAKF